MKSAWNFVKNFLGNVVFFGGPFFLLFVVFLLSLLLPYYGPMDSKDADSTKILIWISVRDLQNQPESVVDELIDRIDKLFGRKNEAPYDFPMDSTMKKIVAGQLLNRREFLKSYTLENKYGFSLKPREPGPNQMQEEKDTGKMDLLPEKATIAKVSEKPRKNRMLTEKNIIFLFYRWYVRTMNAYENAPKEEKKRIMQNFVADLKWWNEIYMNLYISSDLRQPNVVELLKEFELTFREFEKLSTGEEFSRILTFKDAIQSETIISEVNTRIEDLFRPFFRKSAPVRNERL